MSEGRKHSQKALDFAKLCFAVKALICFGVTVKHSHYEGLRGEIKMLLNRMMGPAMEFERILEKGLGTLSDREEDVNGALVDLISRYYDAPDEERDQFLTYMALYDGTHGMEEENLKTDIL
jgi:hypothetical protein